MKISKFTAIALSITIAFGFSGCKKEDDENNSASISFSISGASALGTGEKTSSAGRSVLSPARAGSDTEKKEKKDYSVSLLKISEDGSVKEAQTKDGEIYMSPIKFIVKSSVTNDVFIAYEGESYEMHSDSYLLSPLICVHSNGSYTNLLNKTSSNEQNSNLNIEREQNLYIDTEGTAYFVGSDFISYDLHCFKFNPKTKQRTELCTINAPNAPGAGSRYVVQKFMISNDGLYAYIGLTLNTDNSDNRIIVVNTNTKEQTEIKDINSQYWTYDKYTDALYVTVAFGNTKKYSKNGKNFQIITDDYYWDLFPAENGVYGTYTTTSKAVLTNLTNPTKSPIEIDSSLFTSESEVSIGDPSYYGKDYMQIGNTLFIVFSWTDPNYPFYDKCTDAQKQELYDNDYSVAEHCVIKHAICRINTETGTVENVFANSEFKTSTHITSWSTNGSVLYYSGYNNKDILNGKIDLSNLTHTQIDSAQALSCIAAM